MEVGSSEKRQDTTEKPGKGDKGAIRTWQGGWRRRPVWEQFAIETTGFGSSRNHWVWFSFFYRRGHWVRGIHSKLMKLFTKFLDCQLQAIGTNSQKQVCVSRLRKRKNEALGSSEFPITWGHWLLKDCRDPLLVPLVELGSFTAVRMFCLLL